MQSHTDNAQEYYDRHSVDYVSKWRQLNDSEYLYRKNIIDNLIEVAGVQQGDRVAEIGAGTGLVLRELLKTTSQVVGTDISIEMLRRAQEELSDEYRVAIVDDLPDGAAWPDADLVLLQNDVLDLRLPAGAFDAILSMEVFRYIGDTGHAFRNVREIMKDDSVFAFTVANLWSASLFPAMYSIRRILGRVDLENEIAQYFVTEKKLERTLNDAGLELVELRKLSFLKFNPLVRRFAASPERTQRAIELDRRLASVPLVGKVFDTLLAGVKKR